MAEDNGVRITNREIYEQLLAMDKKLDPLPNTVKDHESRIRALERLVWGAGGVGGVVGSLVTFVMATIMNPRP